MFLVVGVGVFEADIFPKREPKRDFLVLEEMDTDGVLDDPWSSDIGEDLLICEFGVGIDRIGLFFTVEEEDLPFFITGVIEMFCETEEDKSL